ncbi:PTS N-acetylgalactosamine transporter subunit IIB, partial [Peptostreptococcaceae bacterium OttesenSCG-928-C18]|nr:PTS N-acetylgalactosamine transporter subunit IIB [Peptostreptococcaceae bacterium OttesenSCG-928-C18]
VHGQVGVTWTKTIGANLIIVADDYVVEDKLQQNLMSLTAKNSGAGIRFFTLQKVIDVINNAAERQKIFIVVKTPKEAKVLVEGGVPIKDINIGNMHFTKGKKPLTDKVYVDDEDIKDLDYMKSKGVNLYMQDVPTSKKVEY